MYWFAEMHHKDTGILMGARKIWTYSSSFQEITVLETESWGRVLVLDGLVQFTDRDEFIYHEMLVHVAMASHPNPKKVLIIGGGDGGALREVLRHPVDSVVLCEIDPKVIEVVKTHWPMESTVFNDPRVRILSADGRQFVEESEETFDVILVDSSEPVSHSRSLFNPGFFQAARKRLTPPGYYVTQSLSAFFQQAFLCELTEMLREQFPLVRVYVAPVPCYPAGWWSFTIAGNDPGVNPAQPIFSDLEFLDSLKYYSREIHQAAFTLPPFLEMGIKG